MPKSTDKKRIEELCELLDRANYAYYIESKPIMSDRDYDERMRELIELETQHPDLRDPNSPSQRIGDQPVEGFKTVRHTVPMTSIDNTYNVEDLRAWHVRVMKGLGMEKSDGGLFSKENALVFVCDPNIDGVAIAL